MPIYVPGKLILAQQQKIPVVLGEAWGGGYFAGYISHTADGNPTHALIVAPRATGASGSSYTLTTNYAWALNQNAGNGTNYSTTSIGGVANGEFDGVANMTVFNSIGIANFPAAQFCKNLTIGGYTDWYLPSRYELDIAYFNLKPGTTLNFTGTGSNNYSVPKRAANYTSVYPAQTYLTAFNTTSESFAASSHYSSTQFDAVNGYILAFNNGDQAPNAKSGESRVRAFRRIAL